MTAPGRAAASVGRRVRARRLVGLGLVAALAAAACTDDRSSAPTTSPGGTTTTGGQTTTPTTPTTGGDGPTGGGADFVGVRLSKGHSLTPAATPVPLIDGTPLDDAAVQAVLDRLPDWTVDQNLAEAFQWPTQTRPAPIAGNTVDVAFPADDAPSDTSPPDVATGPLHVVRTQPNGDVDIAPFVSITFDQAMVPIETLTQLAAEAVPATISPDVPGRWQWIGTRTLRFDATSDDIDRLPMATDFTVTVPAGTTSINGGALADAATFQFSTPAVTVESLQPSGEGLPLTPVFLATFDQRIDAADVLATVHLTADDDDRPVRLATADEIATDESVAGVIGRVPDDRSLAFTTVDPLPADASIEITVGPGTPSAEGPLTTTDPATYSAHTYEPLRITDAACGYGSDCPPGSEIDITFDNPLDAAAFDPATIRIEPAIAGVVVGVYGNTISIRGATAGRTTYEVTVPAGLLDDFGQQLAEDQTRRFEIGSAAPLLQQFAQPFTTLDPLAPHPSLSVVTVNHSDVRVRVYNVQPSDWPSFLQYSTSSMQPRDGSDELPAPPWPAVLDTVLTVADVADTPVETPIDLSSVLGSDPGHVVVLVETTEHYPIDGNDYWMNRPTITWAQATDLGVDAFNDSATMHAWVTDLRTGAALPGVGVQFAAGASVSTDDDGLATLALPEQSANVLVATKGADTALLPAGYWGGGGWQAYPMTDQPVWYVIDDRGVYRPGETVSVTGLIRRLTTATDAQLQLIGEGAGVTYTARDSQGNVIATGDATVGPLGGFDLTFAIAEDSNLGYATIELDLDGVAGLSPAATTHGFQIEEFRRPEFEVDARTEGTGPAVKGEPVTVAVDADYYAGGPLAAAPVSWQVTTAAATYSPPGWDEYTFGEWTPWWYDDFGPGISDGGFVSDGYSGDGGCCQSAPEAVEFAGVTDADGTNFLQVDLGDLDPSLDGLPIAITAQATVTDVNRQAWASTTNVLVHAADFYVGLRGDRTFVQQGDPLSLDVIVTDIDGAPVAGRDVQVTASRSETTFADGQWTEAAVDAQTCAVTSGTDAVPCTFETAVGGTYTIVATVTDDAGRSSHTELTRWVSGAVAPPTRNVSEEALTIVPDQQLYQPGDTAQLLVQSPFATGEGLLTITRNGIVSTARFAVAGGSAVLSVPIDDRDIPNLHASVEVVGAAPRWADDGTIATDAPARPAYATGGLDLTVSTASRTLDVTAVPAADTVQPGGDTSVDVTVTGPDGAPVAGSELAVVVVDEAVLALSDYQLTDPLSVFYSQLPTYLSAQYGRQSIVLADPVSLQAPDTGGTPSTTIPAGGTADTTMEATAETAVDAFAAGGAPTDGDRSTADSAAAPSAAGLVAQATGAGTIDVRTDFDALAVFEPSVTTDADGHATIGVPLPDNLTRYRVMVVAVNGADQFGSAQANITARLPLMVRPSAPRFLNFGDTFQLPVVLQNQTDADMQVDVVLQADNLTLTGPAGQTVTVPANDRVEVRFAVSAAEAGTARFRVAAVSGDASDAATIELPVYTPATSESFATYGVLDSGATAQPLVAPTDVYPQFGGLEVTTSSTSLQALTDAVLYLSRYPYDSSDAMASRILAISSLRDVLAAFDVAGLPTPAQLNASVDADIAKLVALQNDDGGFPYWRHFDDTDPFNSIQATHALIVAESGGFAVPVNTLDRALAFLADIDAHIPDWYSQQARDSIDAYALNVRMLAGDRDSARAEALFDERGEDLPLDAIAWIWPVVEDAATDSAIETIVENRAVDTADAATFTTAVGDDDYVTLRSDRRTDGLLLDALITLHPDSDLIPKVVAGLLAGQTKGRWDNVQENGFILLALRHYFDTFEGATPEFVAGVWLGDRFAGDHAFVGRSTDRARIDIPTAELVASGSTTLTIANEGVDGAPAAGRLYYRIGLTTAPTDLQLQPLDRGFVVSRTYEAVDDPSDVSRDDDGTWHIKAGATVRVRLTMVAESQRTHVALIDPLPAGLEISDTSLATTPDVPADDGSGAGTGDVIFEYASWYPTWYDHQNTRDDRAEAFSNNLPAGVYDYSYVARATTPGTFVVPPTRAEEMYAPETFGRGASDSVVIDG